MSLAEQRPATANSARNLTGEAIVENYPPQYEAWPIEDKNGELASFGEAYVSRNEKGNIVWVMPHTIGRFPYVSGTKIELSE